MSDFYDITHDGVRMVLPRVTSTIGVLDKSGPLMGWATRVERESFRAALEEVLTEPGITYDAQTVWAKMDSHLKGKRQYIKARDDAANIGTSAHNIINWHVRRMLGQDVGPEPNGSDPVMRAVIAWLDWCRDVEFEPMLAERTVYCPWCALAGTLDIYGKVERRLTVCDVKTGKAVYKEAELQVGWYRHMLKREGFVSERGIILRLPKTAVDPDFEPVVARDVPLSALRAIASTWRTVRWLDKDDTGTARMRPCEVPS